MNRVNIIRLSERDIGGDAELAVHAYKCLSAMSVDARLYTVTEHGDDGSPEAIIGVPARRLTPLQAIDVATFEGFTNLIVGAGQTTDLDMIVAMLESTQNPTGLVFQRPIPIPTVRALAMVSTTAHRLLFTNPSPVAPLLEHSMKDGLDLSRARHVQLPFFIPRDLPKPPRKYHAINLSSIDHESWADVIAQANQSLPASRKIKLAGAIRTQAVGDFLDRSYPSWKGHRVGPMQPRWDAGFALAGTAEYVVDLKGPRRGISYPMLYGWAMSSLAIANDTAVTERTLEGVPVRFSEYLDPGGDIITVGGHDSLLDFLRNPRGSFMTMKRRNRDRLILHGPIHFLTNLEQAING